MTKAQLDTPIREALARISPEPFVQHAAYLLFVQQPDALAPDVHRALTLAVDDSLSARAAAS